MRKTKVMNSREFRIILKNNGFVPVRTSGSHTIYKRNNESLAVAYNLNRMIAERLIKTYNLVV